MSKKEKAYKFFDKAGHIAFDLFGVGMLLGIVYLCLDICGVSLKDWEYVHILRRIIKYLFFGSFGLIMIFGLISYYIGKSLGIDEEKDKRIAEYKEAMRELQEESSKKKRLIPSDERIKSPLKGLTPQQENVIVDLLCNKISVVNGHLKTSELKHLLKALALDGNLDDSDIERVIAWVEQQTGQQVDSRNFKYDYTAKISDPQVTKWGNKIRERFELIEIP